MAEIKFDDIYDSLGTINKNFYNDIFKDSYKVNEEQPMLEGNKNYDLMKSIYEAEQEVEKEENEKSFFEKLSSLGFGQASAAEIDPFESKINAVKKSLLDDQEVPLNDPFENYVGEEFNVDDEPIPSNDPFKPFQTMDYGSPPFPGLQPSGIMQQVPFGTGVDRQQGFTNDTPSTDFEFLQSAYEDSDELSGIKKIQKARQSGGLKNILGKLAKFAVAGAFPGAGLLMNSGGLGSLKEFNQKLRGSTFALSPTLSDYFKAKRMERKAAIGADRPGDGGDGGSRRGDADIAGKDRGSFKTDDTAGFF